MTTVRTPAARREEARAWTQLAARFASGRPRWGICWELYRNALRQPARQNRQMLARLHGWLGPDEFPEIQPEWWPFNHPSHPPAAREEGLRCRTLACLFLARLAADGAALTPEEEED